MADVFDPYYEWLGIPPSEQPANNYRLLGIRPFEESAGVIANAADRQMGHLRGFAAGKHSKLSQKLLNEVAAARVRLLNAEKKAAYDEQLREQLVESAVAVPRAVSVVSSVAAPRSEVEAPLADFDPAVAIHTEHGKHHVPNRGVPPVFLAVGGVAALLLLGALVWWLAGAGASQSGGLEPSPIALRTPIPPGAPSGVADAPSRPEAPANSGDGNGADPAGTAEEDTLPDAPEETGLPGASEEDLAAFDPGEPFPLSPPTDEPGVSEPTEEPIAPQEPVETEPPQVLQTAGKPVPDRTEQEQVRRMLDETYDSTAARPPEERVRLANQLAALAERAGDPTERFVLLRRASELASEGNDPARMLQLVARIADEFEVDRILAQAVMLDGFSKRATSEEQIGALVSESAGVIDAALGADRFDLADSLSASVYRASQAPAGRHFRIEALSRRRSVQEQRDRWNEFQAALAVLEANPDDEAAHMVAGQWYSFVQGDWDQAMPHFAKSTHPELRALAGRELAVPPDDANARVDLADAWWSLAEASDPPPKPFWLARASYWYERALPELASPLLKAKVSKRLEELAGVEQPVAPQADKPPPPAVAPFDARQATQHQQAWSKHLKTPIGQTNSVNMRLVLIPPGEFMMGSTPEQVAQLGVESRWQRAVGLDSQRLQAETPKHLVRITRPFFMGAYPVTQSEYERVMGTNPTRLRAEPNRPVDSVSWYHAVEFCNRLSALPAEQAAGRGYRLPTEAEWEYACRAGTTTWFSFGDDPALLGVHAWWSGNSQRRLQTVARLKPNPWGLFDMHGNLSQWCSDRYEAGYRTSPVDDPQGPATGTNRVVRGGNYTSNPRECRSAARNSDSPYNRSTQLGFRVVLVPASELAQREAQPDEPRRPEAGRFERPEERRSDRPEEGRGDRPDRSRWGPRPERRPE